MRYLRNGNDSVSNAVLFFLVFSIVSHLHNFSEFSVSSQYRMETFFRTLWEKLVSVVPRQERWNKWRVETNGLNSFSKEETWLFSG